MARHGRSHYDKLYHESHEETRRQEVARLRLMAAEAARSGDRAEAKKLDLLADQCAQKELFKAPQPVEPEQGELWPSTDQSQ